MGGLEFLRLIADMRRMRSTSRRDDLISGFALEVYGTIRRTSKGTKQKLALVTAFMHDPAVYILDEPTSGLDPFMQNAFMELLREEKRREKTVMMSSRLFDEVQRICDRAGIIKEGRLVAVEDVQRLNGMREKSYTVTLADAGQVNVLRARGLDLEEASPGRPVVTVRDNYREFFTALSRCDGSAWTPAPNASRTCS
jgi:ABC-2 type transport system ATP-binding protein